MTFDGATFASCACLVIKNISIYIFKCPDQAVISLKVNKARQQRGRTHFVGAERMRAIFIVPA